MELSMDVFAWAKTAVNHEQAGQYLIYYRVEPRPAVDVYPDDKAHGHVQSESFLFVCNTQRRGSLVSSDDRRYSPSVPGAWPDLCIRAEEVCLPLFACETTEASTCTALDQGQHYLEFILAASDTMAQLTARDMIE